MRRKIFGVFGKTFFYTLIIALFIIAVLGLFFANQLGSVINETQNRQISQIFEAFIEKLPDKSPEEIAKIAEAFHQSNTAYEFRVTNDADGVQNGPERSRDQLHL
jgi:predicted negative regulator of RcsB-dependent stress response